MNYAKTFGLGLLIAAMTAAGCGDEGSAPITTGSDPAQAPAPSVGAAGGHGAHGKGPNGGVVFDLGKHHAEFTVDHDMKECAILILGDDGKSPAAIAAKEFTLTTKETKTQESATVPSMTIKMLPEDEVDGKATKFVGADPGLGNVADFEGTVLGEIDGKPSQGEFKE